MKKRFKACTVDSGPDYFAEYLNRYAQDGYEIISCGRNGNVWWAILELKE